MAVKIRKYNLDLHNLPETSSPFKKGRAPENATFTIINKVEQSQPVYEVNSPEYGTHIVDENSMTVDLQEIMTKMQSQNNYKEFLDRGNSLR